MSPRILFALPLVGVFACDLGGIDLGGGGEQALPTSAEGRRVSVGSDSEFEFCPGNLARWSADLDRIDAQLGVEWTGDQSRLYYIEELPDLLLECDTERGCYEPRPDGPQVVELLERIDGRTVPGFVFDRVEFGWSDSLPPFLVHGLASALTDTSCSTGSANLDSMLNQGDVEAFGSPQIRALGQWVRSLVEHSGIERFEAFATKLDEGSGPDYVRSVFLEVYDVPIEITWEDAQTSALVPPAWGWCRAPALPLVDGEGLISETLDCQGLRTQHFADDSYQVHWRLDLVQASSVSLRGQLPERVRVFARECACNFNGSVYELELDAATQLDAGSWRLELVSEEANSEAVELSLTVDEAP